MKKMPQELRLLRKKFPLPVSRLAYTRIYEKAVGILTHLSSCGLSGIGTVELLFEMLANTFSKGQQPAAAHYPVLYGVYYSLLADVEAARLRSEKARENAAKRAAKSSSEAEATPAVSEVITPAVESTIKQVVKNEPKSQERTPLPPRRKYRIKKRICRKRVGKKP